MKLFWAVFFLIVGQTLVWFQLYGADKMTWLKDYRLWFVYGISLPIAYCYMTATQSGIEYFGLSWPIRILTFAIGNLVFFFLSLWILQEDLNLKTIICLGLTLSVILIQIFWK